MRAISLVLLGAASLCGCATTSATVEYDPWEGFNRGVYAVNDFGDRVLIKPVAKGYKAITPRFVRRGVTNFFANLTTPRSALNNFLQGKPVRGLDDVARFLLNSTVGIGGLVDVATPSGLAAHDEDFGQTLAVWGVPNGPYMVLPLLGPSTLRDAFALPFDAVAEPLTHYENSDVRGPLYALRAIDLRARLLTAERLIADSKDPYITIRESYLQNRNYVIHDGDPPADDDFYDDFYDIEPDEER